MAIMVPDYFGNAFAQSFAQARHYAQQEAERKRQEEANKAIAQMYLESVRQPADAAVAPYQQNATNKIMQANTADSNLSAVNAPITTAPDRLADTRSLRFLSMTPEERARAGITPEQSTQMNTAMQAEGPINMQQANAGVAQTLAPIASQANNQAQSAEQMLAMAKEKYGTAMFDRLAPIVASGKVPAQAMISIIERQVQTAEKTALKQAQNNAYKQAMQLMKDGKVDEAKMLIAEYASPDAQGRLFASIGQGAGVSGKVELKNGNIGFYTKDGKIVDSGQPFYVKPEKHEKPTAFSELKFDPQGKAYQIGPNGQIHMLPQYDKPTKDTRLKELDSAEKRDMDYLEKSAKPGQFATPDQLKTYQAQVKALQQKYQGLREGLKQPATTPQGEKPPMTMDMVLEAITKQGEDATRKKLASVYGEEEAERWVGRARNYR